MSKKSENQRPRYRVSFARITGRDESGNDTLGSAREIGAVWGRKDSKSCILRLDHVPVEMARHQGVIFLNPVEDQA